jgi:hypothetical protein
MCLIISAGAERQLRPNIQLISAGINGTPQNGVGW